MSIFGSILSKIFHAAVPDQQGASPSTDPSASTAAAAPTSINAASLQSGGSSQSAATMSSSAAPPPVDVEAVLTNMAAQKGNGGNWQTSIVDLLKLLDLDSSLNARKELATELNVHVGSDGTAEENIALHKAVMLKLAENGGKVPESLKG